VAEASDSGIRALPAGVGTDLFPKGVGSNEEH
jgi:hypothetical protein